MTDRSRARELMREARDRGEPTAWFEHLYVEAGRDASAVPWADLVPNPHLVSFLRTNSIDGRGLRALKVGCGLGDDAEELARAGFDVTAFDISAAAIQWCAARFPDTAVRYIAADLLAPPAEWASRFDFVQESYTLQVLPPSLRAIATANVASFVKPGGKLLVIARAREASDPEGAMPWPLTREEIERFTAHGLSLDSLEDFLDDETPRVRRFRAVLGKAGL